jgi:pimeloyl-ACP methyl ester carboxylesterase
MRSGRLLRHTVLATLSILVAGRAWAADLPQPWPSLQVIDLEEPGECEAFRSSLPSDLTQGFIEVPEVWGDATSPTLRIFYYGRWSADRPPLPIINGGPGFSSHGQYRGMAEELTARKVSFLFFDQRGTGCSTHYPELTPESAPRYRRYGSSSIVRDMEALRTKLLGSKPWDILGVAFGAKVALRYVADAPERLARVFIWGDSVEPQDPGHCGTTREVTQSRLTFLDLLQRIPDLQVLEGIEKFIPADLCYGDRAGLVRGCGFDLLRPLGHDLAPGEGQQLYRRLLALFTKDAHLRLAALDRLVRQRPTYLHGGWQLVAAEDYEIFSGGRSRCGEVVSALDAGAPAFPSWGLQVCGEYALTESMPASLRKQGSLLRWAEVKAGLERNPHASVTEWVSRDHLPGQVAGCPDPGAPAAGGWPRWTSVPPPQEGPDSLFKRPGFWEAVGAR